MMVFTEWRDHRAPAARSGLWFWWAEVAKSLRRFRAVNDPSSLRWNDPASVTAWRRGSLWPGTGISAASAAAR